MLTVIFTQSLSSGQLPSPWSTAFVSPIFKEGSPCQSENYRPVSLTCVACKLMEHILCTHIRGHLDRHGILSKFQHGFRGGFSCETQLMTTLHDLFSSRDQGKQIDIGILDFSKAFDKVPHRRLMQKLGIYGVVGPVHTWIEAFLRNRTQSVIVDGSRSTTSPVTSGVPQGSVLGPLLFLLFINDLPLVLDPSTKCRLFADDCLVYREINNTLDQVKLQEDLNALEKWSHQWGMRFNAKKCNIMTIARGKPLQKMYQLDNTILDHVSSCAYLGVTISENLSWEEHTNITSKKANSRLGFMKRNLKGSPQSLKKMAYVSIIRSAMEYSAATWDPHLKKHKDSLERIQRRAARWICHDYGMTSSVTKMLEDLGLSTLEDRRRTARLTLMYKVIHGMVGVPPDELDLCPADTRTRSSHCWKLHHHRATTSEHRHSFTTRTIPEWNRLPACAAEAGSVNEFKSQLAAAAV